MATSVGRGAVYLTISSLIFVFSGYAIRIWLGQHLGPREYGVYGVVISLNSVLGLVSMAGLPRSVAKSVSEDTSRADAVLRAGLVLQLGISVAVVVAFALFAQPFALLLDDASLAPYIVITAVGIVPYSLLVLYGGYYSGLQNFGRAAATNALYSVAKVAFVVGLAYLFGLTGALVGFALAPLPSLVWWFRRPGGGEMRFPYRRLLLFSLPLLALSLLSTLQQSVDLWFVKALLEDDAEAGYYTASQDIARLLFFALNGIQPVLFPAISARLSGGSIEQARPLIRQSLRFALLLLAPGAFLMAATSGDLVALLYSERYAPAAGPLSILVFGMGFVTLFTLLSSILSGAGRPGVSAILAGAGLLCTAGLCAVLIPALGLAGAAYATAIGGLVSMIAAAVVLSRQFRVLVPARTVARIAAASAVVYLLARVAHGAGFPGLVLPVLYALLFALYVLVLWALREVGREDWERIARLAPVSLRVPGAGARRQGR